MATINGTANNDELSGTNEADSMMGLAGNDTLNGGAGQDTVIYAGQARDYSFGWNNGFLTVTDLNAADGDDGTDYLLDIENLQFADSLLSVKPGGEVRVNTMTPKDQNLPAITGLADGGWLVTWESPDYNNGNDILAQRFSVSGEKVGDEFFVSPSSKAQSYSDVAGLADGGWVVVWDAYRESGDGNGIFGQRYNMAGEAVSERFLVNIGIVNNSSVTALNDGGWLVVWMSRDDQGENFILEAQRYNAAGDAVGGEIQLSTTTGGYQITQHSSDVTALQDGGWLATWHVNNLGESRFDVYAQRYDASGSRVGDEIHVNTYTLEFQYNPAVTALNDGGWLVTWASFKEGYGDDIYFQRYSATGETIGGETLVNSLAYANQDQNFADVTSLTDGGWVVTWMSGVGQGDDSLGIYVQRYDAAGATVGGETLVNTTTEDYQAVPAIASLTDGGWVVTWVSKDQDGSDGGIYSQRFNADGTAVLLEVTGTSGNDILNGQGHVMLAGGDGDDTYVVTDSLSRLREEAGAGTDTVKSAVDWVLGDNFENLMLTGTSAINGTGNSLNNLIHAGAGDNVLNGGAGSDTVSYADATAAVKVSLGVTTAQATGGSGTDTLLSIEKLTGSNYHDTLTGNSAANVLTGGLGNDTLNGGGGADQMIGGDGADTYYVDNAGDVVRETNAVANTGGIDTVYSYLGAYTLGNNVENLRLLATGNANGTGNSLDNVIYASAGNNVLNGGAGVDTVSYAFATAAVKVSLGVTTEQATGGSGTDTLLNVERLAGSNYHDTLTGNAAANVLTGGLGNDTLNGGAGADQMVGGDGSDTYYVDNAGDVVSETNVLASSGGVDTVYSYLGAYTLGSNVENLHLLATGNANGTGNSLNNVIHAGAGNNVLNGGAGTDTLSYAFASAAVTVNLALNTAQATGGSGSDTLVSFENLTGSNYNDVLTGTSAANVLTGGLGNDTLNGGGGVDQMIGGDGADTYYVDNAGDVVSETNALASTGGVDTVYSYLSAYTLGSNVENLRLLATGNANGTGNSLDNIIYAGAGNNVLNGGTGVDTVSYAFATAAVKVSLAVITAQATEGSGTDTLLNVENLTGSNHHDTLTGNVFANVLTGGLGNDTLNGGGGADQMIGGDGSDTYYVDNAGDVVNETNAVASTGGVDTVYSSLSAYTLGNNVENLRLLATGNANGTGNSLDNLIYAGTGNNVINGAAGVDTVSYAFATAAVKLSLAVTTAQATGGSGTDTLLSVENLTGSNYHDTLIGNAAANVLTGGLGNDTINGGAGNDLLIGGVGTDKLYGGSGADRFDFNALNEMGLGALRDVIGDFKTSEGDKIDLSTLDANVATAANDAFVFIGSNAFSANATGQLRFADGILYGSTDADTAAEFEIQLLGVSSLQVSDLMV